MGGGCERRWYGTPASCFLSHRFIVKCNALHFLPGNPLIVSLSIFIKFISRKGNDVANAIRHAMRCATFPLLQWRRTKSFLYALCIQCVHKKEIIRKVGRTSYYVGWISRELNNNYCQQKNYLLASSATYWKTLVNIIIFLQVALNVCMRPVFNCAQRLDDWQ